MDQRAADDTRNMGTALDLDRLRAMQANTSAIERRAATLQLRVTLLRFDASLPPICIILVSGKKSIDNAGECVLQMNRNGRTPRRTPDA